MPNNIQKLYTKIILASSILLPLSVTAQVNNIVESAAQTIRTLVALLFILATVIFLWGVIQFIAKAGDEAARTKAKGIMTWGIIGLAVMAAAWGIATVLINYFGVSQGSNVIPTAPGGVQ